MKGTLKSVLMLSALTALSMTSILFSARTASALPSGMSGSYIGAGVSAGVTGDDDGDTTFGGNVQGRFDVPTAPVSVRGAALFSDGGVALMPLVSYDLPVSPNANLYLGAGYSFVTDEDNSTPLGNQNAPVVTAGVEASVNRNLILYGDVKLGIDAYRDSSDSAVSFQVGAGYRF